MRTIWMGRVNGFATRMMQAMGGRLLVLWRWVGAMAEGPACAAARDPLPATMACLADHLEWKPAPGAADEVSGGDGGRFQEVAGADGGMTQRL